MSKTKIIIVIGPTAAGKSALAVKLAKDFNGEIINADSVQIYKHFDIGTAKPTPDEMGGIRHHLIDILEPYEPFSAADFREAAIKKIKEVTDNGKNVFVVGGTGLYVKILLGGIIDVPRIDEELRAGINEEIDAKGIKALYDELKKVDAVTAATLSENDRFRIVRALEVYRATGVPISKIREEHSFKEREFDALTIGLELNRNLLYQKIEDRVEMMVKAGLEEEVKRLIDNGCKKEHKPMSSIGYKQMMQYLNGEISKEDAIRLIKRDTKRYAKRQFTWFKKDANITWYNANEVLKKSGYEKVKGKVACFLEQL